MIVDPASMAALTAPAAAVGQEIRNPHRSRHVGALYKIALENSGWSTSFESSKCDVSSALAVAPAWSTKPVRVAQPATRRMLR